MKIRIKGNSIRIRLSRTEIADFGANGYLEERTEFSDAAFAYVLQSDAKGNELSADFANGKITVYVPVAMQKEWVETDVVGYEHNMPIGDGQHLFLLIEKDFKCIDNTTEDQSDNYEHPTKVC
jgi:hypothetical protein